MYGIGVGLGAGLGANLPTPPYATNLVAWYRSDRRVSVNSGDATGWGDISGNARDMTGQGSGGHHPTYTSVDATWNNLPSIQFASANNEYFDYNAVYGLAQPFTIIWIGSTTSTHFGSLIDGRGAGLVTQTAAAKTLFYAGNNVTDNTALTSPSFVAGVFNHAGSSALYVDSSTASSAADPGAGIIGGGVNASYFVGGNNGLSFAVDGTFVEIFIYSEAVSQPHIATIVAYAASRYGQAWT